MKLKTRTDELFYIKLELTGQTTAYKHAFRHSPHAKRQAQIEIHSPMDHPSPHLRNLKFARSALSVSKFEVLAAELHRRMVLRKHGDRRRDPAIIARAVMREYQIAEGIGSDVLDIARCTDLVVAQDAMDKHDKISATVSRLRLAERYGRGVLAGRLLTVDAVNSVALCAIAESFCDDLDARGPIYSCRK